jgi:hypothetical protein
MTEEKVRRPLPINIIAWFGICLAATYLLYGIISTVLTILDRSYKDIDQNIIIIFYGLPIMVLSIGFKNLQKWGWVGYLCVLIFATVWSAFHLFDIYGIILGILSLAALIGILLPSVRKHYFPG